MPHQGSPSSPSTTRPNPKSTPGRQSQSPSTQTSLICPSCGAVRARPE
ncbi:alanine-glyoxylate aminotransferase, isoform CRA_a [Rattus norvegicus]|nr:alanine-glyoxylate aminotransferase, isoform CRA_a [Rattus norvegicus]